MQGFLETCNFTFCKRLSAQAVDASPILLRPQITKCTLSTLTQHVGQKKKKELLHKKELIFLF